MSAQPVNKRRLYEFIAGTGYTTIRMIGNLQLEDPKPFETESSQLIVEPFQHVVINCAHLSIISKPWIRAFVMLAKKLSEVKMELRLVCVGPQLAALFKDEGVDGLLKTAPGLRDALVQFGLVTRKAIDTEFINPFLDGTMYVLEVQAATKCTPGKLFAKTDLKYAGDISGVIGLVTDTFNGTVVISFPEATFLNIISRMLGEKFEVMTPELADGAGELINIIFGRAKVALNKKGYGIKTALPSVVTGKNHSVHTQANGPVVVVPFDTDVGQFYVEICASQPAASDAGTAHAA